MSNPINSSLSNKDSKELALVTDQQLQSQPTKILDLPIEVLLYLFTFGDHKDLCKWSVVCKSWKEVSETNILWKGVVCRIFPHLISNVEKSNNYLEVCKAHSKLISNYKNKIATEKVISSEMTYGEYASIDVRACKMVGGKLFVFARTFIEMWNPQSKVKEETYPIDHQSHYVVGEENICVKKYSDTNKECVFLDLSTLKQQSILPIDHKITALHREKNHLALGTTQGVIEIWDLNTKTCLKNIRRHKSSILELFIKGDYIYTIAFRENSTLFITHLSQDSQDSRRSLNVGEGIGSVLVKNGKIFVGCLSKIKVYDEKTYENIMTLVTEPGFITHIFVEGTVLIAGSKQGYADNQQGKTEVWDMNTGKRLNLFDFFPLDAENGKICVMGKDNCIVEWDFNTPVTEMPESPTLLQTLAGLGIVSEKDFSEKLQVRPSFLKDVGIKTPEDLQYLKIAPVSTPEELEAFKVEQISLPEANTLEELKEQQNKLLEIRDNAKASIDKLLGVVQRGMDVSNQLDVFLESTAKWENLRDILLAYKESMGGLTCKELLNGAMEGIFEKITQQFKQVEKEHQVAILKAYLLQPGLLGTWTRLNRESISSLSELMNSSERPANLFQMGE